MPDPSTEPRSFAEVALEGEDSRRRADTFARPARTKFRRHLVLFLIVNALLATANLFVAPGHLVFYYLTIMWAFVLGDNFLWAYVVDPDRDVAEREALRQARRQARSAADTGKLAAEPSKDSGVSPESPPN